MKFTKRSLGLYRILGLSCAAAIISVFSSTKPAHAWFQVCNRSTENLSVAFGYADSGVWNSSGWWSIGSGECAVVYSPRLRYRDYFVYAEGDRGGRWRGEQTLCTIPRRFTLANADRVCGNGGEWKEFSRVDTGNAINFIYTLQN